jgi:tRNA (mo5U34)-methyltransferase
MENENPSAFEHLSDLDLETLNNILPWKCFTRDSLGRVLGKQAWNGKRSVEQEIPDPRIIKLHHLVGLNKKSILEVGCFEGVHTIGLSKFSSEVYAVDVRIENVVKTLGRSAAYGVFPKVFTLNLDDQIQVELVPEVDVLHHVGVLYHLYDPVNHLKSILPKVKEALLLDTHYATPEMANQTNISGLNYFEYKEFGYKDVFSGINPTSKWLLLDDIKETLKNHGFLNFFTIKNEHERNGPRVSLVASKKEFLI